MENWTNLDKGREGVKNPGNFADVLYVWSLSGSVSRPALCFSHAVSFDSPLLSLFLSTTLVKLLLPRSSSSA